MYTHVRTSLHSSIIVEKVIAQNEEVCSYSDTDSCFVQLCHSTGGYVSTILY